MGVIFLGGIGVFLYPTRAKYFGHGTARTTNKSLYLNSREKRELAQGLSTIILPAAVGIGVDYILQHRYQVSWGIAAAIGIGAWAATWGALELYRMRTRSHLAALGTR